MKKSNTNIKISNFNITDDFFTPVRNLVRDVVIPYQHNILEDKVDGAEKSHAIENFRIAAGDEKGTFYGMVFQDSDVAKWIEASAYSLESYPDKELEKTVDDIIDIIGRAQGEDGYLNTFFTVKEPEHRFQNLQECHELYCAGHMIEAAVAYYEATGKEKLLNIMIKMSNLLYKVFIEDENSDYNGAIPGHPEIELALMRLYHVTGNEKYMQLAELFVNNRGQEPNYFETETKRRGWAHFNMDYKDREYSQNHMPVRKQTKAAGHAVRAVYLYTGMADLAGESDEEELFKACDILFDNIAYRQSYITGSIGSTNHGEAFTTDYDLPNDTIYAETCAAIGLIFFADKMLTMKVHGKYSDLMERALYNGVLSGMQLDGKRFFYVNPLEVSPDVSGIYENYRHVLPQRPPWFGCACCPPNVARLITSLGKYAIHYNDNTIYSNLYIGGKANIGSDDNKIILDIKTKYPVEGLVTYTFEKTDEYEKTLAIRIPWFVYDKDEINATLTYNNRPVNIKGIIKDGYAYITKKFMPGDVVELKMDIEPKFVYANTAVRQDAGKVAVMRGPVVYSFEGNDNKEGKLLEYIIQKNAKITEMPVTDILNNSKEEHFSNSQVIPLKINAYVEKSDDNLYSYNKPVRKESILTAIPYYAWGNRGLNEMCVWMRKEND